MTRLVNIEVIVTVFSTSIKSFLSSGSLRESRMARTLGLASARLALWSARQNRVDRPKASWTGFLLSFSSQRSRILHVR